MEPCNMVVLSRTLLCGFVLAGLRILAAAPSAQPPATPTFEVASIKAQKSTGGPFRIVGLAGQTGGRLTATNVTARQLVQGAYEVYGLRVVGAPAWFDSD